MEDFFSQTHLRPRFSQGQCDRVRNGINLLVSEKPIGQILNPAGRYNPDRFACSETAGSVNMTITKLHAGSVRQFPCRISTLTQYTHSIGSVIGLQGRRSRQPVRQPGLEPGPCTESRATGSPSFAKRASRRRRSPLGQIEVSAAAIGRERAEGGTGRSVGRSADTTTVTDTDCQARPLLRWRSAPRARDTQRGRERERGLCKSWVRLRFKLLLTQYH